MPGFFPMRLSSRAVACVAAFTSLGILAVPLAVAAPAPGDGEGPVATASATPGPTGGTGQISTPTPPGSAAQRPRVVTEGAVQGVGAPWPLIELRSTSGSRITDTYVIDYVVCTSSATVPLSCATASGTLDAAQRSFVGSSDLLRRTVDLPAGR